MMLELTRHSRIRKLLPINERVLVSVLHQRLHVDRLVRVIRRHLTAAQARRQSPNQTLEAPTFTRPQLAKSLQRPPLHQPESRSRIESQTRERCDKV
uniref:Uncharacterized protein n=1 Tax=Kalanchoe fedtschenkoi TaxID=63787 RepID=A0A7N0U9Z5_KALFE